MEEQQLVITRGQLSSQRPPPPMRPRPRQGARLLNMLLPLRIALLPCSRVSTIDRVYTKHDAQKETSQSRAMRCHAEAKCRSRHVCATSFGKSTARCQLR